MAESWGVFLESSGLLDKKDDLADYFDEGYELRDLKQMDLIDLNDDILDDADLDLTEEEKDRFRVEFTQLRAEGAGIAEKEKKKAEQQEVWVGLVREAKEDLNKVCPGKWPQIQIDQTSDERHKQMQNQDRTTASPMTIFYDVFTSQHTNQLKDYIEKIADGLNIIMIIKMLGYLFILITVLDIRGTPACLAKLKSITNLEENVIVTFSSISPAGNPKQYVQIPADLEPTDFFNGITGLIDRVITEKTLESTNEKLLSLIAEQKEALKDRLSFYPPDTQTGVFKMGGGKKKRKSKKRRSKKRRSKKRRSKKRKTYRRRN